MNKYDLSEIKNSYAENAGGLCQLSFAPIEWLASEIELNLYTNEIKAAVSFVSGRGWLDIIALQDSLSFNEVRKDSSAGPYYEGLIACVINGDNPSIQKLVQALSFHEFVIKYKGRNGEIKLIGSKKSGASFKSDFTTGSSFDQKHFYNFSFAFESKDRAPFYPF